MGVLHAQGRGPLVHPGGERLQGAVQVEGGRVGGVVARGQQHPRRKACQGDAVPCLQTHGGALHRHHFLGDIHQGVALLLSGLQGQKGRHDFGGAGHGPGGVAVLFKQDSPCIRREHHSALGGNLRPCRPRHRAQRPHQAQGKAQGRRPVSPMLQHKSPASQKPMRAGETLCVKHPGGQAPPAGQGPGAGAPPSCPLSGTGR